MATKKKKTPPRRKRQNSRPVPGWTPEERAAALAATPGGGKTPLWPWMTVVALVAIAIPCFFLCHPKAPIPLTPAAPLVSTPVAHTKPATISRPRSADMEALIWNRLKEPKITFTVLRGAGETAELRIFTPKNKLVRLLRSEAGKRGWVTIAWDGLDSQGKKAPAGIYFARMSREGGDSIRLLRVL